MMKHKHLILMTAWLAFSACSEFDMQGQDPKAYYAKHPIENKVETKQASVAANFEAGSDRLLASEVAHVRSSLREFSPLAVEDARILLHPSHINNASRREHLSKLLRSMGYEKSVITFVPASELGRNEVEFSIDYAAVVSPRCPDWRTSGITTYSNTSQAGYSCANVTNLGLQVADPRDLQKGTGNARPDSGRNSIVIDQYRKNITPSTSEGSADSSSASSATAATP